MSQSHHCHNLRVRPIFQGISAQGESSPKLHSCFLVEGGQVGSKPLQALDSETKWNWVCKTTIRRSSWRESLSSFSLSAGSCTVFHNFYQPPKIVTRPDWSLDCRLQTYTTQTFWNSVALSLGQVLWIYIQNFTSPFMPYAHMACPCAKGSSYKDICPGSTFNMPR